MILDGMLSFGIVCAIVIAGEGVHFDANQQPQFTPRQVASTTEATRAGLTRVAATEHGRALIAFLDRPDFEVDVIEDATERGAGRAPEPGLATLIATGDHAHKKIYAVILNPLFFRPLPKEMEALPGQPATPADAMALAWAGELLHVEYYAHGISLPHHPRPDFQDDWLALATDLGMPTAQHDDAEELPWWRQRAVVRVIGVR